MILLLEKNLEFINENNECPICLDNQINCVRMPNCIHIVCLGCFKKCFNAYDESRAEDHRITSEQQLNLQKCPLCRR